MAGRWHLEFPSNEVAPRYETQDFESPQQIFRQPSWSATAFHLPIPRGPNRVAGAVATKRTSNILVTMITITGVIGGVHSFTGPHGLVTTIPVNTAVNTTLKIAFGINSTVGTGFQFFLCAGSMADFSAHSIALELGMVTGPGYQTLTIIDTDQLAGKVIYVLAQGTGLTTAAGIEFTINVE